jgi:hypothetical protein
MYYWLLFCVLFFLYAEILRCQLVNAIKRDIFDIITVVIVFNLNTDIMDKKRANQAEVAKYYIDKNVDQAGFEKVFINRSIGLY